MTSWVQTIEQAGVSSLGLLWAAPLIFAALVANVRDARWAGRIGVVGNALILALAAALWRTWQLTHQGDAAVLQHAADWGPLRYHVGLDGLSALLAVVASVLGVLVAVYGVVARKPDHGRWQAWCLVTLASLHGMLLSLDLLLFAAFAALEVIPAVALIRGWGTGAQREEAATRLAAFFGFSQLCWLAASVVIAWDAQAYLGEWSFALVDLVREAPSQLAGRVAFVLFLAAVAVRLPLFPFHAWMPSAVEQGPVVALTAWLLGVKVGAVALARFVIPLTPEASVHFAWIVSAIGVFGLIYGALVAFAQTNLRRLLAFAVLSHMGIVVPGLFSLNVHGVEGALLEVVNLGIASAGLFFVVGFLRDRTGTTDLAALRGLAAGLPLLSVTFLVLVLTTIGMPGTTGFEGMHLIVEGELDAHNYGLAVVTGLGAVMTAGVMLLVYQGVMLAPRAPDAPSITDDLRRPELLIAAALVAMVVVTGLLADPWIEAVQGAAHTIEARVHAEPSGEAHP